MISRFEYNVQTGERAEIQQVAYRNEEGDLIVLDKGVSPPSGFSEFTGDLAPEEKLSE